MKRLYFLIPDVENAAEIAKAMRGMGVLAEGMHVIVKEDQDKLEITQLLEAGVFETTDILRALVRGAIIGGIAGFIAGFTLVQFPPEEFTLSTGTIVALTIFGVLFGSWSSSLIGISIPNPMMEKFERAVEAGGIMLLMDLPDDKEIEVIDFMRLNHPETKVHGASLPQRPLSDA